MPEVQQPWVITDLWVQYCESSGSLFTPSDVAKGNIMKSE